MNLHAFLDHRLGPAEEINGGHRCPTYMYRWILGEIRRYKIYLHKFVGDDWSRDLHDHPKRFWSIGLWGSYVEWTPDAGGFRYAYRRFTAPWIRSFPAEHRHRITTPYGHCWTLVIVGPPEREWGFWPGGKFMPWKRYVEGEGGFADRAKACD